VSTHTPPRTPPPGARPAAGLLPPRHQGAWARFRRHRLARAGLVVIVVLALVAALAPLVAPLDPNAQDLFKRLAPPGTPVAPRLGGGVYWLGTDHLGRDLLSRVIWGARVSLAVGLVAQAVVLLIGVPLGAVAGYFGGRAETAIMRTADVMFAFPDLLFAMGIMFAIGPSLVGLFVALGCVGWAGMARLVRGQVLQLKEREYVEAARAAGAPPLWIIARHLLPNALGPIIVAATLGIPGAILSEAALSFLGLGVQPPDPTWGGMIDEGRDYLLHAPLLSVVPGAAIMLTVLAFNLVGDGLRDALDPRTRR
jgi:ABC-type dipeptide/oligopeptide/nickel transport system permease subunit